MRARSSFEGRYSPERSTAIALNGSSKPRREWNARRSSVKLVEAPARSPYGACGSRKWTHRKKGSLGGVASQAWVASRTSSARSESVVPLSSLPVHPLPLYYASFAAVLALVMILMVRRGVSPGSLLLVAVAAEPPVRLALEQLRGGFPWRDWTPIVATLVAWMVVDATVLAAWGWPERRAGRGKSHLAAPPAPSLR